MKQLVEIDPETGERSIVATFSLRDGVVEVDPPEALERSSVRSIVGPGNKVLRPRDGVAYYRALDRVCGTFYEVVSDDRERAARLRAMK